MGRVFTNADILQQNAPFCQLYNTFLAVIWRGVQFSEYLSRFIK